MTKYKIALASSNGSELTSKHFGDSELFILYELDKNGTAKRIKEIKNEFVHIDEKTSHGSAVKRKSIISYIGDDIDFIVASQMSPNFKKINMKTSVCPIVSLIKNIDEILTYLKNNFGLLETTKKEKLENTNISILKIDS